MNDICRHLSCSSSSSPFGCGCPSLCQTLSFWFITLFAVLRILRSHKLISRLGQFVGCNSLTHASNHPEVWYFEAPHLQEHPQEPVAYLCETCHAPQNKSTR